jgi:hypothetical protein
MIVLFIHIQSVTSLQFQKKRMIIASLLKEMCGKNVSTILYTQSINKGILCLQSNDVGRDSKLHNTPDGHVQTLYIVYITKVKNWS